jgi:hypothetical protein
LEIANESTDESAGVLGDQRPHDRLAIVERHEAIADGRLKGRLMESFGVFVAAPKGNADAAGRDERRGVDDPLAGGGTGHASHAAEDRRTVELDICASGGGDGSELLVEDRDGELGFGESGLKEGGEPDELFGQHGEVRVHGQFPVFCQRLLNTPTEQYALIPAMI